MKNISLKTLKGLGPKTCERLENEGIYTAHDLVMTLPKGYDNYVLKDLTYLEHDQIVTIDFLVLEKPKVIMGKKMKMLMITGVSDGKKVKVYLFNQNYLFSSIEVNERYCVKGKYDFYQKKIMAQRWIRYDRMQAIKPLYGIEGVYDATISKALKTIFENRLVEIEEILPDAIRKKYQFISRNNRFFEIHFPSNEAQLKQVIQAMKYEEAYVYYEGIKNRSEHVIYKKPVSYNIEKVKEKINQMPYELTMHQKEAINDIFRDFKLTRQVNRLIQGDVGSGKTVVAMMGMYGSYTANKQSILVAPTKFLAEQHYQTFTSLFKECQTVLLTGQTKDKNNIKAAILDHQYDVIIGTHALLEEDVMFHDLGLIIIDEQHKFGVIDRKKIMDKETNVNTIYLTATPIPRTLFITHFHDISVSNIQEKPKERKPVITEVIHNDDMHIAYEKIKKHHLKNERCYLVVPAIDSDKMTAINAVLAQITTHLDHIPIFVLHGRQSKIEQENNMQLFYQTKGSILLSTTMIEVGIDVADATLMVVLEANRFGLSQLHQLRGRVGRSHLASECLFVAEDDMMEKLQILKHTSDGFKIAEYDLKLRGPGEFLGTKQSGHAKFMWLENQTDEAILLRARQDVFKNNMI